MAKQSSVVKDESIVEERDLRIEDLQARLDVAEKVIEGLQKQVNLLIKATGIRRVM